MQRREPKFQTKRDLDRMKRDQDRRKDAAARDAIHARQGVTRCDSVIAWRAPGAKPVAPNKCRNKSPSGAVWPFSW